MTTQVNLRFSDEFLEDAKNYSKLKGFRNVQDFIYNAVREKLYEHPNVRPEYVEFLTNIKPEDFLSVEESEKHLEELKKRAGMK